MAGPNIQMPAMLDAPPEVAAFLQSLQMAAYAGTRNGSTNARPTEDFLGRYEGMCFLDRTLGKPVFLKHASSNVWIDATGAVV